MSIIIPGSDFLERNISHIGTNPVPVLLKSSNNEFIKCVINARVLLATHIINPEKFYQFFPTHAILSTDGYGHYIDNPRTPDKKNMSCLSINHNQPIISNSHEKNPNGAIIGYRGSLTGTCMEKYMFLPYVGMNAEGVKQIQYGYIQGHPLSVQDIGEVKKCLYIRIGTIEIPIYNDPDGGGKYWDLIQGKEYTFDCYFGDDEGYGSYRYSQYAEYLYLSGLITDMDFDPFEQSVQ